MTEVIIATRRGVAPHNVLPVDFSLDRNVLSDGESENIVFLRQTKAIAGSERKCWRPFRLLS